MFQLSEILRFFAGGSTRKMVNTAVRSRSYGDSGMTYLHCPLCWWVVAAADWAEGAVMGRYQRAWGGSEAGGGEGRSHAWLGAASSQPSTSPSAAGQCHCGLEGRGRGQGQPAVY